MVLLHQTDFGIVFLFAIVSRYFFFFNPSPDFLVIHWLFSSIMFNCNEFVCVCVFIDFSLLVSIFITLCLERCFIY